MNAGGWWQPGLVPTNKSIRRRILKEMWA